MRPRLASFENALRISFRYFRSASEPVTREPRSTTLLEAIKAVLSASDEPLRAKQIASAILERGLYAPTNKSGFHISVTASICANLERGEEGSIFRRSSRGLYTLNLKYRNENDVLQERSHTQTKADSPKPRQRFRNRLSRRERQKLAKLHTVNPFDFEQLVAEVLSKMGYHSTTVTKRTKDGGVDILARIHCGFTELIEVFQVKRQQSSVSAVVVRSLRGCMHNFQADRATIVTTSTFARGARYEADSGDRKIRLVNGRELVKRIIALDLTVQHTHDEAEPFANSMTKDSHLAALALLESPISSVRPTQTLYRFTMSQNKKRILRREQVAFFPEKTGSAFVAIANGSPLLNVAKSRYEGERPFEVALDALKEQGLFKKPVRYKERTHRSRCFPLALFESLLTSAPDSHAN